MTLVDFAGHPSDIEKLHKLKDSKGEGQKRDVLLAAVTRLVKAASDKLFEFEGTTAEIALQNSGGNAPGISICGLSKRVATYHNDIKKARGLNVGPSDVPLMELDDLRRKMKEREAPKQPTALDAFLGKGK